jgi:hypothetical protein
MIMSAMTDGPIEPRPLSVNRNEIIQKVLSKQRNPHSIMNSVEKEIFKLYAAGQIIQEKLERQLIKYEEFQISITPGTTDWSKMGH